MYAAFAKKFLSSSFSKTKPNWSYKANGSSRLRQISKTRISWQIKEKKQAGQVQNSRLRICVLGEKSPCRNIPVQNRREMKKLGGFYEN